MTIIYYYFTLQDNIRLTAAYRTQNIDIIIFIETIYPINVKEPENHGLQYYLLVPFE